MVNQFVNALSDEIVNLTDGYKRQIHQLTSTLKVYRAIVHPPAVPGQLTGVYCLIIKINHDEALVEDDDIVPYNPFVLLDFDERWIYAVSDDMAVLQSFKSKMLSYTPERYRRLLDITIVDFKCLTKEEVKSNFIDCWQGPFNSDILYYEGIVNRDGTSAWTIEEFTANKWDFKWNRADEVE